MGTCLLSLIRNNIAHVIGNGNSTFFWNETWVKDSPLNLAFPRLYALLRQKDATVAHCWNSVYEAWDLGLRRNLYDVEIQEWTTLSTLPLAHRDNTTEDKWKWKLERTGQFTTKSLALHFAFNGQRHNAPLYKNIWKGPIPKKILIFLSKRLHGLYLPWIGVSFVTVTMRLLCTFWFSVTLHNLFWFSVTLHNLFGGEFYLTISTVWFSQITPSFSWTCFSLATPSRMRTRLHGLSLF